MMSSALNNNNIPIKLIYLLQGSDVGQLLVYLAKIKKKFPNTKKYYFLNLKQFIQFYNTNQEELFNRDLFCGLQVNKIIEIYLHEANFSKLQLNIIESFIEKILISNNICLIFLLEKFSTKNQQGKWFQLINQKGMVFTSKNLSPNEFKSWLMIELSKLNLSFTREALSTFIDTYRSNLLQAKQVISKLYLYYTPVKKHHNTNTVIDQNYHALKSNDIVIIDDQNLKLHIDDSDIHNTLLDLQNSFTTARLLKTIKILNNLKQQGIPPILILWSIIQVIKKDLSKYDKYKCVINNNKSNNKHYNIRSANLLAHATDLDLAIKHINLNLTSIYQEQYIWHSIVYLCINICKI